MISIGKTIVNSLLKSENMLIIFDKNSLREFSRTRDTILSLADPYVVLKTAFGIDFFI